MAVEPLVVDVYSDFLCPWCFNAWLRMRRIEDEFGASVDVRWRSYLLRPYPQPHRNLERFREYTHGWLRAAADEPLATFHPWQGDAGPPTHSVPALVAAKAAASLGAQAGNALRSRLFPAYFAESRDISAEATLRVLWSEAGLPPPEFARTRDPAFEAQVRSDHAEAVELGATGAPAVRVGGSDFALVGAQPIETWRRWIARSLERRAVAGEGG